MEKTTVNRKVALITGAGEGIGKATAEKFAREGFRVACLGRNRDNTQATVEAIQKHGGEACPYLADITDFDQLEEVAASIRERWGRLDVLFANAGVNGVWAAIEDLGVEEFEQTVRINLNGTFYTIKAMVPLLKTQGGSVIITSSVNGTRMFSNTGATAYSCTKAAQVALTKMLALELAPYRIRVNCICPGAIKTNIGDNTEMREMEEAKIPVIFPEGKVPLTKGASGKPEQCAEVVYFLANDGASHVSGTVIYVDGAQSLLQG